MARLSLILTLLLATSGCANYAMHRMTITFPDGTVVENVTGPKRLTPIIRHRLPDGSVIEIETRQVDSEAGRILSIGVPFVGG